MNTMNDEVKSLYFKYVNDYKTKLDEFNSKLSDMPFECIFNNQLLRDDIFEHEIKGIIVMDNPGQEEKEQGAYLVGTAGKAFNKVLKSIGLSRENVLVFNKSSFTTPATNDLNSVYANNVAREVFLQEQKVTFEVIKNISLILKIPLMIHGYASYLKNGKPYVQNERGNRVLYVFFHELIKSVELHEFAHFYKHSSYGNLSKQISAYAKELGIDNLSYAQYLDLGRKNLIGFFD